jgi:thiamine biosynthesis protein ThiS
MLLTVNGEVREAPEGENLAAFLASLELEPGRVAIERNREITPRSLWKTTRLQEGDALEIVQFVGGG